MFSIKIGRLFSVTIVKKYVPPNYDFIVCSGAVPNSMPERNIQVDSLYIGGNITHIEHKPVYHQFRALT